VKIRRAFAAWLALTLLGSCAHAHRQPVHVPVESRPTPPPPPVEPTPGRADTAPTDRPAPPINAVLSPDEQQKARARIVADTTATSAALARCAKRKLLPDQESVFETTRSLLDQTRGALIRNELWNAESLARKARQLASSLDCPG
jgi:hypothetical protein